jgi:hypothetical protein
MGTSLASAACVLLLKSYGDFLGQTRVCCNTSRTRGARARVPGRIRTLLLSIKPCTRVRVHHHCPASANAPFATRSDTGGFETGVDECAKRTLDLRGLGLRDDKTIGSLPHARSQTAACTGYKYRHTRGRITCYRVSSSCTVTVHVQFVQMCMDSNEYRKVFSLHSV